MQVRIISVPYDSGHYDKRMGRGPDQFMQSGLREVLQSQSHVVETGEVRVPEDFSLEVGTAFEISRALAAEVGQAREHGFLPVILAGNCNTCIGTLAGLNEKNTAVIWFDAHGDLNTPETSPSGFFDGMAISVILGRCWQTLAQSVPGFSPVADQNVLLIGARDLDAAEEQFIAQAKIQHLRPEEVGARLDEHLHDLSSRVHETYLHIDLDVLDSSQVKANAYAAPGGILIDDLIRIIEKIINKLNVTAMALTAYDPDYDSHGKALAAGQRLLTSALAKLENKD